MKTALSSGLTQLCAPAGAAVAPDVLEELGLEAGDVLVGEHLGDVRAVAALLGHHGAAVGRVLPQLAAGLRGGEELLRHVEGDLVRRRGLGQVGALVLGLAVGGGADDALDVRPVAADADHDGAALGVVE